MRGYFMETELMLIVRAWLYDAKSLDRVTSYANLVDLGLI